MTGGNLSEDRCLLIAPLKPFGAAGMEPAAGWYMDGTGRIPFDDNPLLLSLRICHRDGGQECLSIRMQRVLVKLIPLRYLHNLTEVHDGDPIADVLYHPKVVSNEKVGQPEFRLEILEEIDDLRLNGDI
jgi:hypothetical protein